LLYFCVVCSLLSMDCAAGVMYWGDGKLDTIETAYLNGSGRQVLLNETRGDSQYFAMALDDQYLYFTDWSDKTPSRSVYLRNIAELQNVICDTG